MQVILNSKISTLKSTQNIDQTLDLSFDDVETRLKNFHLIYLN